MSDLVGPGDRSLASYRILALERGLKVLTCFSRAGRPMTLKELSEDTGIPMSTTFRLVATLETTGYLEREPDGSYRPGVIVLGLSRAALQASDLVQLAQRPLRALADRTGQTVNLAVLQQDRVLYLIRLRNADLVTANIQVGSTLPAAYSSLGKVLLAHCDPTDIKQRLSEMTLPPGPGPNAVSTIDELAAQFVDIRRRGFAIQDEELAAGLRAVAAPVRNAQGEVVAAINVAVNAQDFSVDSMLQQFEKPLLEAASQISGRLGAAHSLGVSGWSDNFNHEEEGISNVRSHPA